MTQEEKRLLLIDLCARLPYGVVVDVEDDSDFDGGLRPYTTKLSFGLLQRYLGHSFSILPYLRPLSSMTEEERKEYESFIFTQHHEWDGHGTSTDYVETDDVERYFTWLNKKGFDYRGLIPMGLALEAPEDMYD